MPKETWIKGRWEATFYFFIGVYRWWAMNFNMDINVRFCCLYGRIFYLYTWKAKGCTQFLHLQLCANCKKVVKAENKSDTNSQHFFLHLSRRMAWKKLRHGVGEKFPSPCKKKTRVLSPNWAIPINFYK